jgi:glutathione S-transferase
MVLVRRGSLHIAKTKGALTLAEASYPPVQSVPRRDIDMSLLERSRYTTYCPYKGEANYYSIPALGEPGLNSVWTYETPFEAVGDIAGCLAFYPDRLPIELADQATTHTQTISGSFQHRIDDIQEASISFSLGICESSFDRPVTGLELKVIVMAIKIYGDPGSGSLRRVTTAAKIMGIELERVKVDLFKGESQTDEFKSRLNPHGLTPVLEDGDMILYEASAINLYLADKINSPLVGTTEKDRFQVLQWMFWSGEQWRTFTTTIFDERVGKTVMKLPKDESLIAFAEGKIRATAKVLDKHLEGRKFMVGDALTFADLDVAAPFSQVDRAKFPFKEFPNLIAWHDNLLRSFPAWAETKAEVDNRMETFLASVGVKL